MKNITMNKNEGLKRIKLEHIQTEIQLYKKEKQTDEGHKIGIDASWTDKKKKKTQPVCVARILW